jgi:hypothetical protein
MRSLFAAALVPCAAACVFAQLPDTGTLVLDEQKPAAFTAPDRTKAAGTGTLSASEREPARPELTGRAAGDGDENAGVRNMRPTDYRRPDANARMKNFLREAAGPGAIIRYTGTAAVLTWRNSPAEWGAKPAGFGRRLANVTAKGLITTTTTYALDEALGLDSSFYLSRDRSVAARLRNVVFSAVTARNKRGHRVPGIPRIVGGLASEVSSSVFWYPSRYDQDHGFKGAGVAIGIAAGVNLFREFVVKR